jgi:hypothetical protein
MWTDRQEMMAAFGAGLTVAEVGVWRGVFSRVILECNPRVLCLVDCWQKQSGEYERDPTNNEDLEQCYCDVVREFGSDPRVRILRSMSHDAARSFSDGIFDVVYIDANHTWPGIANDLYLWWPKVKSGGWLGGHDYCHKGWIEVAPVVAAWAKVRELELHLTQEPVTDTNSPSWAFHKR